MERLRQQDAEAGDEAASRPLTDDQKEAIATARRDYEAKVAEAEILMRSKLAAIFDLEGRREVEANHRRDLGQFASSRDRKIAAIREGDRP
jgi:Mg-chelatase subunit ChlI